MFKEYQLVSSYNSELEASNDQNKKTIDDMSKTHQQHEKVQKKYEVLLSENDRLKKENMAYKSQLSNKGSDMCKREKEIKDKEMLINDLKDKTDNWLNMIKEREKLILESNNKIKELNEIITQKDEQLKVMVNFSKEINNENKSNVAELTKQAVKTIKIFYNTLNNNNKEQIDNAYRIEFKNNDTTFSDFEQKFKGKKCSFELEDAVNGMMYIPVDLKSINKEFLMDMNFKTELIKSELYSGLIRESTFAQFLEDIFAKLNIKDSESIETLCSKVISLKAIYEKTQKENEDLKKSNNILLENKREYDLYTKKLKEDMRNGLEKLKEKFDGVEKGLELQLNQVKDENKALKDKYKKDINMLKGEISSLRNDNAKKTKELELLNDTLEQMRLEREMNPISKAQINQSSIETNNNRKNALARNWNMNNKPIASDTITFQSTGIPHNTINPNFNTLSTNNQMMMNQYNPHDNNINNNSLANSVNDSFNERNLNQKKQEISNLKDEIAKIKNEMSTLLNEKKEIQELSEREDNSKLSKINPKLISDLESQLGAEQQKNHIILNELNEIKLYCNDLENQLNQKNQTPSSCFTPQLFLKMFCDSNNKIFSSSELKKYYSMYNAKNIFGIIEIFNKNCEIIKKQIYETHFDIDTSYTEIDESFINSKNGRHQQEQKLNNSYRLVNDRIVRLKKFEFDFANLCDFVKNYLVAQEIVVKMLFGQNTMIELDPIEHLFGIFEDSLNFKIDEMNDDMIFNRKIVLRMFKNQKICLCLSLQ